MLTTLLNEISRPPGQLRPRARRLPRDRCPAGGPGARLPARAPAAAAAPGHRHPRRPAPAAGPLARPGSIDRAARRRPALHPRGSRRVSQPGDGPEPLSSDIAALEARTEGWIAGLQLAALALQGRSMPGHPDAAGFIQSFTGSHHFVLDYLLEEVLQQQPERIQAFLLRTALLDRLCGPLCDAFSGDTAGAGQETLENLEHANLFIVPLDDERAGTAIIPCLPTAAQRAGADASRMKSPPAPAGGRAGSRNGGRPKPSATRWSPGSRRGRRADRRLACPAWRAAQVGSLAELGAQLPGRAVRLRPVLSPTWLGVCWTPG